MAAASSVMETRLLLKEGGKEAMDMLRGEWVGSMEVGLKVAVVFVEALRDLGAVEVILGGVGVQIYNSCGGGGGSFNNGTNQQNKCCYNSGERGRVIITFLH